MNGLALLLLGLAASQATPPPTLPPLPPPAAAPAAPDTATADLVWTGPGAPRLVSVAPDTVLLGGALTVTLAGVDAPPDTLGLPDWLEAAPAPAAHAGGKGLALTLRAYRLAPFRLRLGEDVSDVVTVVGRNADPGAMAPVRDPRLPGWAWRTLLALAVAALLVLLLVRRLLARRRTAELGRDRPLHGAAWPRAATDLAALLDDLGAGGEPRVYLDGLRRVARTYVRDRFLVAGRGMTGEEIERACVRLGHDRAAGRRFADLVAALDGRRYDPRPVDEGWCLERTAELRDAVAAVRIVPQVGAAPEAERAWARLAELPVPARRGA